MARLHPGWSTAWPHNSRKQVGVANLTGLVVLKLMQIAACLHAPCSAGYNLLSLPLTRHSLQFPASHVQHTPCEGWSPSSLRHIAHSVSVKYNVTSSAPLPAHLLALQRPYLLMRASVVSQQQQAISRWQPHCSTGQQYLPALLPQLQSCSSSSSSLCPLLLQLVLKNGTMSLLPSELGLSHHPQQPPQQQQQQQGRVGCVRNRATFLNSSSSCRQSSCECSSCSCGSNNAVRPSRQAPLPRQQQQQQQAKEM